MVLLLCLIILTLFQLVDILRKSSTDFEMKDQMRFLLVLFVIRLCNDCEID